jgi:hypothetical protein
MVKKYSIKPALMMYVLQFISTKKETFQPPFLLAKPTPSDAFQLLQPVQQNRQF